MWDGILNVAIKLAIPAILTLGFILVKKGCQILSRKLDIEISTKEREIIDRVIEEAVRAVEEDSKAKVLSSEDKEELALAKVKQTSEIESSSKVNESTLRNKIRACVNKLYNHSEGK